tara:strand:+ start:365 stop:607 length:243 start_codon:yes stop_codon:yes gene_type:complete
MNSNTNTERMLLNELARVTAKLQSCERKMQQMKLNERVRNGVLRTNNVNDSRKKNSNTAAPRRRRYDLRPLPHRRKLFDV